MELRGDGFGLSPRLIAIWGAAWQGKDKAALQISTVSMSFLALYYPTNLRQQFGSTADPNAREFGNDVQRRKGRSDLWLAHIRVSESDDIRLRVSVSW